MANMTYCGRIYLDPRNKRDVYINVGWVVKDKQIYPPYEQWLAPYVTEQKYNEWIVELQKVFATSPIESENAAVFAMMCCAITAGALFCPCLYFMYLSRSFQREIQDAFKKVSGDTARIKLTEYAGPSGGMWVDSKGQMLMLGGGKQGARPGGPPLGFNIIISLPSPIEWPPTVQLAPGPTYLPPITGYAAPPTGFAPPPTGYAPHYAPPPARTAVVTPAVVEQPRGLNVCSCGNASVADAKFCSKCGKELGLDENTTF